MTSLWKEQRERRGLTEKEVAALAGLHPSHYCRLEKGRIKSPQERTLKKLRGVLLPTAAGVTEGELRVVPNSLSLDEFLDRLGTILKRGEVAGLRPKLLPMADWVRWLHHALLELQDRYEPPGR